MTPSESAKAYAKGVTSGKIPAGEFIRLACQRFLDDLKRKGADWPYKYDAEKADRAVRFMEKMPHTKGKWAAQKRLLVLEPWQHFIECNLFGWVHKKTGHRRFRRAYEEIPRKNGKSLRLAARGLYLFCADGEAGAEVYSGATSEKQAYEVFRPAWQMVQKLPALRARFGIEQAGKADANSAAIQGLTATVTQQGQKLEATAQDLTSLKTQVGDVNATAFNQLQTTVIQQGTTLDATAQDLASLKTQVGDVSARGFNQLKTQVTEQGQAQASQAQQISGIQTSLGGKADASVVQTMEARVKTLGGGGNLLRTATMTGSLDPAWFTRWATGSWERSNLIIQDARVPRGMRAMVHYANGGQAVNSQVLTAQQVPAEPGKSYMGSVYCNSYLGRSNISVFFVDANGNLIGSEFASSASRKYGANGSLSDYERLFVLTGPAPANASTVWLQIATTKESAAGQDCAGWYVQPMLEQCPPDASLPSLWSAGGGEALAQWGVAVRADRKVGGVQLTATGEISAFDVLADMFRVSSPSAGMRTEYSDGNWRVYDQNGRLRMRWGVVP